jgi:hypothetical protein
MNTTPKNVPIKGSAWGKSTKAGPTLAMLLAVLGLLVFARGAWALTMLFDTSKYSGDVWLQIQDPFGGTGNKFQATYNNGTSSITFGTHPNGATPPQDVPNLMSNPVKLSDIGTGGLNVTYSLSCVFFLFYDDPSATPGYLLNAPGPFDTLQRYQQFEMTMRGLPNIGDQGNLTNIDCFTAPLSIRSYQNNPLTNPAEPVLQSTGYGSNTSQTIVPLLASASGGAADAVKKNAGKLLRYIGPSKFDPTNTALPKNPWPSFVSYAQSLVGTTTTLKRANSFGGPAWTPSGQSEKQLYTFGMDMTATTNDKGVITVSGKITAAVANPSTVISPNPSLPTDGAWTNVTVTLSPLTGPHTYYDYDYAIYGQSGSPTYNGSTTRWSMGSKAITLGADWENFQTFCINTLADPSKSHDTTTNKSLQDLDAYITTQNMVIGEITTGLLGGYYGSTHQAMYNGTLTPIKDMPSQAWWQLNPMVGFAQIQSVPTHYNQYANVIWNASGNTVYGVPYSDRFGSGPLVNSVQTPAPGSVNVGYWVIGVGAPVGAPTAGAVPATNELLLLNNQ